MENVELSKIEKCCKLNDGLNVIPNAQHSWK